MGTQQSTKFSEILHAPSVVSQTAIHYGKEGRAPTLDVQQFHPPLKSYFNEFCFLFHTLMSFLFHKDLKLSYKLGDSCNTHCSSQMLVYLYFGKLFCPLNILQMSKCTLELWGAHSTSLSTSRVIPHYLLPVRL